MGTRCGKETHTVGGAAEGCMGLETTAQVPIIHVLSAKRTLCFIVTFPELACHYRMRKS